MGNYDVGVLFDIDNSFIDDDELTEINIYRCDTPTIVFTVTQNETAYDLVNVSEALFCIKKTLLTTEVVKAQIACSIDSPTTDGICRAVLSDTETDRAGTYYGELQFTYADDVVRTIGRIKINFAEDIAE